MTSLHDIGKYLESVGLGVRLVPAAGYREERLHIAIQGREIGYIRQDRTPHRMVARITERRGYIQGLVAKAIGRPEKKPRRDVFDIIPARRDR